MPTSLQLWISISSIPREMSSPGAARPPAHRSQTGWPPFTVHRSQTGWPPFTVYTGCPVREYTGCPFRRRHDLYLSFALKTMSTGFWRSPGRISWPESCETYPKQIDCLNISPIRKNKCNFRPTGHNNCEYNMCKCAIFRILLTPPVFFSSQSP